MGECGRLGEVFPQPMRIEIQSSSLITAQAPSVFSFPPRLLHMALQRRLCCSVQFFFAKQPGLLPRRAAADLAISREMLEIARTEACVTARPSIKPGMFLYLDLRAVALGQRMQRGQY